MTNTYAQIQLVGKIAEKIITKLALTELNTSDDEIAEKIITKLSLDECVEFCKETELTELSMSDEAFDECVEFCSWTTMGACPHVDLVAQKAPMSVSWR